MLRTIEHLGAAGWETSTVELPGLQEVAARFDRELAGCGFELNHVADRRILQYAETHGALFGNLLVIGLNAAHWPLWPLLRSAVTLAERATVVLENPNEHARGLDEAWVGTWENFCGAANPIATGPESCGDTLFTEEEMRGSGANAVGRIFLVGTDATQQAEAIAKQCADFLAEPTCERIGIVFPGRGSLPRLVSDGLQRRGIPHYDNFAHFIPAFFEAPDWRAWLELQEHPRIDPLLRLINALPADHRLLDGLERGIFEKVLCATYAEILVDDLPILRLACAEAKSPNRASVARTLERIPFLPARDTLSQFLDATKAALDQLGWESYWLELSRYVGEWSQRVTIPFSRILYLRWLRETASSLSLSRDELGSHPYAPVQLMTVAQASCGQQWSHLIFAGANEGSWPPPESGEFIRENQIDAFNRTIRELNTRATQQGRYGEGHVAVKEGHTFYLGPNEQRQIACRQFDVLVETVKQQLAFTASLVKEDAPEQFWNPSELLTRQYLEARNHPLTQPAMIRLQAQTEQWLNQSPGPNRDGAPEPEPEPARVAYDARRNPNVPSGEYDFALRSQPPFVPTFSVSEFEQLMSTPALVWLKRYVGVKAAEDNAHVWNSSTGKWVHDWLAAIAAGTVKAFAQLPHGPEIERRLCAAAEAKREHVTRLCRSAGKPVPDWWLGGWRNAVYLARALSEKLTAVTDFGWAATEWTIDNDEPLEILPNTSLRFRGRIDLLLSRSAPLNGSLSTDYLWIVDYKTGAKKALSTARQGPDGRRAALKKKLLDGSALQLSLYALAAMRLGADVVEVSLLSPLVRPLQPQMSGADFASEAEIFAELGRMQQTGIFGMHGSLRSAFRFTEAYPLATVAVDPDILEQRWELTHPALVRDEEDIF